jgi:hypothetical protein
MMQMFERKFPFAKRTRVALHAQLAETGSVFLQKITAQLGKKFFCFLRTRSIHYGDHKSPPLIPF